MKLEQLITEMPKAYSFPPDATKEQKEKIRAKVIENINTSVGAVKDFGKHVEELIKSWETITKLEGESIQGEETTRFGPFQEMHKVTRNLMDARVSIQKIIDKLYSSSK